MEKANLRFLKNFMGFEPKVRPMLSQRYATAKIDKDLIQSGDMLGVLRMDGLDPFIGWDTGAHIAHCVVALRFEGELYITESQNTWFWPVAGIQRTKFDQWMIWADAADYNVAHLPLNSEKRAQFDEQAAIDYFYSV
jgi:hypothetical protein